MSEPGIFEAWARDLPIGFNGPKNQALWRAMAKVVGDNSLDDAQAMVRESLPQFASAEANGHTANDRGLEKLDAESNESFGARLVAARDVWALAGTPVGLLMQFYWLGLQKPILVQQNGRKHYLTGAPVLAEVSAFVAAMRAKTPTAFPSWYVNESMPVGNPLIPASADGKPAIAANTIPWTTFDAGMDGEGNQWCGRFGLIYLTGITPPPDFTDADVLARAKRTIAAWKPQARRCVGIWVAGSSAVYGMGAKYGTTSKYGGSGSAHYAVE